MRQSRSTPHRDPRKPTGWSSKRIWRNMKWRGEDVMGEFGFMWLRFVGAYALLYINLTYSVATYKLFCLLYRGFNPIVFSLVSI